MLRDARLKNLRKLAWIWSFENWVLAIAAFYRLAIYIDFNGMTRMRVIGILGVGTVVMGFGLVVYKIIYTRSFAWLIQGNYGRSQRHSFCMPFFQSTGLCTLTMVAKFIRGIGLRRFKRSRIRCDLMGCCR